MRAGGVSSAQIVAPLLGTCLLISVGVYFWNEYVVPDFATRAHYINTVEIKKRQMQGLLGDQQIWAHGQDTFYNIQSFDTRTSALVGVTIYPIDPEFHLKGLIEIPRVEWAGSEWRYARGIERRFAPNGEVETITLRPGTLELKEKPADLMAARRDADEFSYHELRDLIENLRKKGLDTTEYVVDLQLKLAVPFVCTVMGLIAMPIGMRNLRSSSLTSNIGVGLLIGAGYWFVLALAVSLGHSGALPPIVSAWTANGIFAGIGLFLLLGGA
jgi:lipopolysaccharide export system permease protein